MKNVLKIVGAILLVYIVVYSCNTIITKNLDNQIKTDGKEFFEKDNAITDVERTVTSINNKTPFDTGGGLFVNDVEFLKDKNEVIYNYQTIEKSLTELSEEQITNYRTEWKNNVLKTITSNPNNASFVKAKVNFIYKLVDKTSVPILNFRIEHSEYK